MASSPQSSICIMLGVICVSRVHGITNHWHQCRCLLKNCSFVLDGLERIGIHQFYFENHETSVQR